MTGPKTGSRSEGFAPTVVLETSPGNFQTWLDHGQVLPRDLSTLAARELALRFDGDSSSADWRHYGRLAPSDISSGDNQWRKTLDTTTPYIGPRTIEHGWI